METGDRLWVLSTQWNTQMLYYMVVYLKYMLLLTNATPISLIEKKQGPSHLALNSKVFS